MTFLNNPVWNTLLANTIFTIFKNPASLRSPLSAPQQARLQPRRRHTAYTRCCTRRLRPCLLTLPDTAPPCSRSLVVRKGERVQLSLTVGKRHQHVAPWRHRPPPDKTSGTLANDLHSPLLLAHHHLARRWAMFRATPCCGCFSASSRRWTASTQPR